MSCTIIANLKAYLSDVGLRAWVTDFAKLSPKEENEDVSIIICPPVTHLFLFREYLDTNNMSFISLGVQDIAAYEYGAYTGEITAQMVSSAADYVLLGHSERRKYKDETPELIQKKITFAQKNGLQSIVLMEQPESYSGIIFGVGYEPTGAIGTGHPEAIEAVIEKMNTIQTQYPSALTIYGGSVDETNILDYSAHFNGVLVGTACKDASEFVKVIQTAS